MINTVLEGLDVSETFFNLLASYIADDEKPDYEKIDHLLYKKFIGTHKNNQVKKFTQLLSSPKCRDSLCFITCVLVLKNQCKFLQAYIVTTRSIQLLNVLTVWLAGKRHMERLSRLFPNAASGSSEDDPDAFVLPLIKRILSVVTLQNLAETKDILHFLNDVVYFMESWSKDLRAKIFTAVTILLHRNNEKFLEQGKQNKVINIEETFNMLLGVTDDEFLLLIRDYLAADKVYDLYDGYIYNLLKQPYDLRMKFVKGHILLLMRQETVKMIEEDSNMNFNPTDFTSVTSQVIRVMTLTGKSTVDRFKLVLDAGEKMKEIASGRQQLMISNTEEEDIFEGLTKCPKLLGGYSEMKKIAGDEAEASIETDEDPYDSDGVDSFSTL